MNIYEKIRNGGYENKVPLSPPALEIDEVHTSVARAREMREEHVKARREQRRLYDEEEGRLRQVFQADLEAEYGLAGHPKADRLFGIAWDHGHSSGYSDVAGYYGELAELLKP